MPDQSQPVDLASLAKAARERLSGLAHQVENLVRRVDPIELLAQLALLFQTHPADGQPNRDESAKWQVRIEWLAWLIFARGLTAPPAPEVIDGRILGPLEALLDDYFAAWSMALVEPVPGLSKEQNDVRADIQLEALHVRGMGFQHQLEHLAVDLYSPHEEWCLSNLGLTVQDAFAIAKAISERFSEKLHSMRQAADEIRTRVVEHPAVALDLDLPPLIRASLADGLPEPGSEEFANAISMVWFFSKSPEIVGFTLEELQAQVAGQMIPPERVAAFLDFISIQRETIQREPDPLELTPLAITPLVRQDGRFYLFVPGVLFEALFYAFHNRLFADKSYRPRYDEARAELLERSSLEAFRKMLPKAESGWNLLYGPKKRRLELDGLLFYDNKLILVECKWKSPTLLARRGDVVAALADIDSAILAPLAQAKRARDYVREQGTAEFTEKSSGRRIVVRSEDVSEVFLVTLVGSGAWALIAANLARLAPLGLFSDGEYPWALSLNDLRVVGDCLELPSQLFDYLRRRYDAQRNPRFRFHDEWDLLGVYLAGALDIDDPRFSGMDLVTLDGFDSQLQDYCYSLSNPMAAPVEKPRRQVPTNIWDLIVAAERAQAREKTDAICAVLSWPERGLVQLSENLEEVRRKAVWDGRAHAVAAKHPWRPSGITLACGYKNQTAIQQTLLQATELQRLKTGATEWVGFGVDLYAPDDPVVLYYNQARRH